MSDINGMIIDFGQIIESIKTGPLQVDNVNIIRNARTNITEISREVNGVSLISGVASLSTQIINNLSKVNNKKIDDSVRNVNMMFNYTTQISKSIVSTSDKINFRSLRRSVVTINRLSSVIPQAIVAMSDAIRKINKELGSQDKVQRMLGWTESGEKEFLTYTDKNGNEHFIERDNGYGYADKVSNPRYFKPHFAAETGIFKIGEYFSQLIGSIDKITSIDAKKTLKQAAKMRMMAQPLANTLKSVVDVFIKEFNSIDTNGISNLVGDEKTEERFVHLTKNAYNVSDKNAVESNYATDVTNTIKTKKAGILDTMTMIFGLLDKIISYPVGKTYLKLLKFHIASSFLAKQTNKSFGNFIKILDDLKVDDKTVLNFDSINKITKILDSKNGVGKIYEQLFDIAEMYLRLTKLAIITNLLDKFGRDSVIVEDANGRKRRVVVNTSVDKLVMSMFLPINIINNKHVENISNAGNTIKKLIPLYQDLVTITKLYKKLTRLSILMGKRGAVKAVNNIIVGTIVILDKICSKQLSKDKLVESRDKISELAVIGRGLLTFELAIIAAGVIAPVAAVSLLAISLMLVALRGTLWLLDKLLTFDDKKRVTNRVSKYNGQEYPPALMNLLLMAGAFLAFAVTMALIPSISGEMLKGALIIAGVVLIASLTLVAVSWIMKLGGTGGIFNGQTYPPALMNLLLMAGAFLAFAGVMWLVSKMTLEFDMMLTMLMIAGVIAVAAAIFGVVGFFKNWILTGTLITLLMGVTMLMWAYTLREVSDIAQSVSYEQMLKFDSFIGIFAATMAGLGIPIVAGLIALGSGVTLLMAETYMKLAETVKKIGELGDVKGLKTKISDLGEIIKEMAKTLNPSLSELKMYAEASATAVIIRGVIQTYSELVDLIDKLANLKVADQWDKDGRPTHYVQMDSTMFSDAMINANKVSQLFLNIADTLKNLDDKGDNSREGIRSMRRGKRQMKIIAQTIGPLNDMLDIIRSLATRYDLPKYDDAGREIGTEKISIGEYVSRNQDIIKRNIGQVFDIFNTIGEYLIQRGGGYEDSEKTAKMSREEKRALRRGKKQLAIIGDTVEPLMSMLDFVQDLASGKVDMGDGKKPISIDEFITTQKTNINNTIDNLFGFYESIGNNVKGIDISDSKFDKKMDRLTSLQDVIGKFSSTKYSKEFDKTVTATKSIVDSVNSLNETKVDKLNNLMQSMTEFGRTMNDTLKDVMDEIIRLTEELQTVIEMSRSGGTTATATTTNVTSSGNTPAAQVVTVPQQPVDISNIEDRLTELTGFVRQISSNLK